MFVPQTHGIAKTAQ